MTLLKFYCLYQCEIRRKCSTKVAKQIKSRYSNTLCLPQTKLPLRLEGNKLNVRDENITKLVNSEELYKWQREYLGNIETQFILHDGPPYANGPLHMGHAINKILKDILLRHQMCQGKKVHYIPGWDCHGLPIEIKACQKAKKLSPIEIRAKANKFAKETIEMHKSAFKSWGILGDWKNYYATNNSRYVQNQLRQFYNLYELGLVYRDVKPVFWSPSSRTALAEAELEYNAQHTSLEVTLRLLLTNVPDHIKQITNSVNVYALIWTTTPWTLPANQAICFNPNISYSLLETIDKNYYIVAANRTDYIKELLNIECNILLSFEGNILHSCKYHHPVEKDIILPFLPGEHTSDTKGTGLVHTAPAHGPEDFLVALNNNLSIKCLVDETGCYNNETIEPLKGLDVLSEGNAAILDLLKNDVLHTNNYVHSYPYDWRTKKPVILRASKQWFIDTNSIKEEAINLLQNVRIVPEKQADIYKNSLITQLSNRPYWCISRQRVWGVPIPVFYNKESGKSIITRQFVEHLCNLFTKEGPDAWWKNSIDQIIPAEVLKTENIELDNVEKGEDILDIWFDSGLSWSAVLDDNQIADMYLEGVDQFTGWFQSSLLTSIALRHKAPYKMIYVHGFVVDENGRKMSKSLGNVINPEDIIKGSKKNKTFGIDALRWWTACHANQKSVASVSYNILQSSADDVQKLRSVLRFALSCLNDFNSLEASATIKYENLSHLDKYLLHMLYNFQKLNNRYYDIYHLHKVCTNVINFITNEVSAFYYTAVKDRLYCNIPESLNRKQAQYVLKQILDCVSHSVAPILPHLVEELHMHSTKKEVDSFFKKNVFVCDDEWKNDDIAAKMEQILNIKKDINKIQPNALNMTVTINAPADICDILKEFSCNEYQMQLVDILQISEINIHMNTSARNDYTISVHESNLHLCERCRKMNSFKDDVLCSRCFKVIENINSFC